MIDLQPEHLSIVCAILEEHVPECEVWAFGSRVNGRAKRYSDLDLVLRASEALDWRRLEDLKYAFSESDLPIIVDVLDWHATSDQFRATIENQLEPVRV